MIAQAYLTLPDKVTTQNLIAAGDRATQSQQAEPTPMGMGRSQAYQPQPPPQSFAAPGYGYYPPPPAAQQGMDPTAMMSFMQEAWREAVNAAREGRQPI